MFSKILLISGIPLLFLIVVFNVAARKPAADLIVTDARVWTVDRNNPEAQAIAVLRDRIVAVGSNEVVQAWRDDRTRVISLKGKLVLPGFNDSHLHFVSGGFQLDSVDLKNAPSAAEFARLIGERAKARPNEWVLGGDWDEQKWTPAEMPSKELIDPVTGKTPVFVSRYDGHLGLANSLALKMAGLTSKTPDPPGGIIVRDKQGNPTGILKDAAMSYVYKVIPDYSRDQRIRAVRRSLKHAAQFGVTSVQDMNPSYDDISVYSELAEKEEVTVRIYCAPMQTDWKDQAKIGIRRSFGSPYLRMGALKGYADGSLGSTTAYFFDPYSDQPHTRGILSDEMQPPEKMLANLRSADAAGLQLCVHAIGDQGISIVLDQFAQIARANGARDRRMRVEHAQHMARKDFKRFSELEVIASMQPYHAIDDGRWAAKRIGPERIKTTYAFRTFLDQGVKLAFGSDWSVAPLNPLEGIYAAVTRRTLDDKNPNGWVPEEKITVAEAVEAYTLTSAYAEFQENEKGSITPGKLADFVILNEDIFKIDPVRIREVKVQATYVGGREVWSHKQ